MSAEEYSTLKDKHQRESRAAIHALFERYALDVLVAGGQAYAPAGTPAINVPVGYDESGQPASLTLVADYLGEPALIAAAYAFEQATQARVAPGPEATIEQIDALSNR